MSADASANGFEPSKTLEPKIQASKIIEYQIPLPITVDEYHIGQLYGVAEASKNETGGGEGIEVVENRPLVEGEPYYNPDHPGQYTHKIFHLQSKVPAIIRKLAPNGSLQMVEKAWNCYPDCRTEYSNKYMADNFYIIIDTKHKDARDIENVHNLSDAQLKKRDIQKINIATDPCDPRDYKITEDPTKFHSEKTGRGPLTPAFPEMRTSDDEPQMVCYKLYSVLFKWRVIGSTVENLILKNVRRLLFNFHRQVFCWIDQWHGMTVQDIRDLEEKTKKELEELRATGEVRGMSDK